MTSELVMRMRTCAAALADIAVESKPFLRRDAAELLVEASNLLDMPEPLGEPMPVLEAVKATAGGATWTAPGELPEVTPKPCPACGNVSARMANIVNRKLLLTCPMCSHQWEYAA